MKRFLKTKSMWTPVWMVSILMIVMAVIYIPIFSKATPNVQNFPIVIINEDTGSKVNGQQVDMGKIISKNIANSKDSTAIKWQTASTRADGLKILKNNKAYAALIIPKNYTASTLKLQGHLLQNKENTKQAKLELIVNKAGGQFASGIAQSSLQAVATSISKSVTEQISGTLNSSKSTLSPENALVLANPIQINEKNISVVKNDNGMTPFIMALLCMITGMMGSQMVNGYVDSMHTALKTHGLKMKKHAVLNAEIIFGICMTALMSILLVICTFAVYKVGHTANLIAILGFLIFGSMTMFMFFQVFNLFFGRWSLLIAFPINIMGIFASGGPIPVNILPSVHQIFSNILPTHHLVDGMRSLIYYDGRMASGLSSSLIALSIFLVVSVVLCYAISRIKFNKDNRNQSAVSTAE
ncbi:YhgE/Pip domain-containing protein [Viridibacillus arvi]|uniref:YhgE/Pip domain-containing protein n=1 Tax=Viridibacillus arvi TaxID=263475 RepID=UPI00187B7379|nr:ABC transporter permease [Viridibacillus sp. JNUCC-6]QOV11365.1 ABC transporter permease [Viridibacillus sp. JNUCC-6]